MTDHELMTSTVWHVEVYHESNKIEYYTFWNEKDVLASINTTWSKKMDSIRIEQHGSEIDVYSTDLLNRHELSAHRTTLGYTIMDRPTHF